MNTLSVFELLPELTNANIIASKIKAHISTTIFDTRKSLNLDQKELAEKFEVSQAMISKWESGQYNFSIESLAQIADKLDLDLDVSLSSKKEAVKFIDISKFRDKNRFTPKCNFKDYVSNEMDEEEAVAV